MKKNKDTIAKLREKNKRLRSDLAKKKAVSKNLMGKGMHCNIPFFIPIKIDIFLILGELLRLLKM